MHTCREAAAKEAGAGAEHGPFGSQKPDTVRSECIVTDDDLNAALLMPHRQHVTATLPFADRAVS